MKNKIRKEYIVFILTITNIIIWNYAIKHTINYFEELLQTNVLYENRRNVQSDLGVLRSDGDNSINYILDEFIGTKAWAIQKWSKRFDQKTAWQLEVIMDTHESGWDANAFNCNTNGSVDLSWYQINSTHVESGKLSLACAADPICSTDFAMDLYEDQGWCPWYGARKLGFCK